MSTTPPDDNPYRTPDGSGEPPSGASHPTPSSGGEPAGQYPPYGSSYPNGPSYPTYPSADGQSPYGGVPPYGGGQAPYGSPYGPPPGYGPGGGYGGYYPDNGLAGWSLALALVGFFCCAFFTSIPAIVLGMKAKKAVARGTANNDGMATAGLVIGWIVTILYLGFFLLMFVIGPAMGWLTWSGVWQDFDREMQSYDGAGLLQAVTV